MSDQGLYLLDPVIEIKGHMSPGMAKLTNDQNDMPRKDSDHPAHLCSLHIEHPAKILCFR